MHSLFAIILYSEFKYTSHHFNTDKNFDINSCCYTHIETLEARIRLVYFHSIRVAQWLATCTRKPKTTGSRPTASYVQRRVLCSNRPANV